jgi:uncharacterized membrane protein YqjE
MSTASDLNGHSRGDSAAVGELVTRLSEQTSTLVRQELELARAELTQKGRAAGIGAGMFGGAGLLGFFSLGALTAAAILALATALPTWLAALIVAAAYGAAAAAFALTGRGKVREATPPTPERALESTKEDLAWAKSRATTARS